MLSQSQSLCLNDAIELLTELTSSLKQSDTANFSLPRVSRQESSVGGKTGSTSPEHCEGPGPPLESQERECLISSLAHIKSLLLEEREKQLKTEAQHLKINHQLASALSSTSLHTESLKKQLHQANKSSKGSEANAINDYNSSGSERENLNRETKLLTEAKSRLQDEVSGMEKRIGLIKEAGKKYDGLKQDDLKMNLGVFELEINKLREEVNLLKSEKKKLKTDKQDLVGTLKQLYSALDEKEGETSTLMKSYDRRLTEKDELLTASMSEKRTLENERGELVTQSLEQADSSRKLREELTQLQKRVHETASDVDRTRRARSPTESSCGKSQHSYGQTSSQLGSHSYSNMHQGSAGGSEEASSASEYARPGKNSQYRATGISEFSRKSNGKPGLVGSGEKEDRGAEQSPQYATVGPPSRRREKKCNSHAESSLSKSLDRDLNRPPIPTPQGSYSSFRMSERRSSSAHLHSSQSVEFTSPPIPSRQQKMDNAVREETHMPRARSRSMTTSGHEKEKNNGNIFSNSLSRIFSRNKRKKPANTDRHSAIQAPTYSNLPPQVSSSGKHQLLDTNRGGIAPKREAPLPPQSAVSDKLQNSCSSLTRAIFGSEERKIGLLEETRKVHISRWNQITVLAWMDVRLGMTKYLHLSQHVIQSGQTLLELTERDYEAQLGITNPVHKRKLQLAIEDCRRPQNNQHANINEIDHYWVAQIWLPKIGLSRYSKLFYSNLVDGRILRSLQKREADELLKIAPRIDQLSLTSAIQLLRHFSFNKDLWLESLNTEPVCWDNERIHTWLQSIDLMEYADQVLDSGVHGALVCLEPSFTYETLAYIMNIPQGNMDHRRSLRRQLESLTNSFKGFHSPGGHDSSLTRSYSVPRSYTTPRHSYVADKQHTANSYSRAFTQGSAASISRNLSLSFNSSTQSLSRKRLESTPV